MSRLGSKIASELLKEGEVYNVKRRTGEATVKVLALTQDGVEVLISQGGFESPGKKIRRGQEAVLPYDSDWYEPEI